MVLEERPKTRVGNHPENILKWFVEGRTVERIQVAAPSSLEPELLPQQVPNNGTSSPGRRGSGPHLQAEPMVTLPFKCKFCLVAGRRGKEGLVFGNSLAPTYFLLLLSLVSVRKLPCYKCCVKIPSYDWLAGVPEELRECCIRWRPALGRQVCSVT